MDIPVVLFIYKRPTLTKQVFKQIVKSKPKVIFVFANGPMNSSEEIVCEQTRNSIFLENNEDIKIIKNYEVSNIGMHQNFIKGLNLVFTLYDQAIILEDDCMPHLSFFTFCTENLKKYNSDEKIMQISGTCLLENSTAETRIIKSKFSLPNWGWATWKRAWKKFNSKYDTYKFQYETINSKINFKKNSPIIKAFESLNHGNRDSWDVQWMADIWLNNGLTLIPNRNLVSNLGISDASSYMSSSSSFCIKIPQSENEINFKNINGVDNNIELKLEKLVSDLTQEFINTNKNTFTRTKQIISQIEPRLYELNNNSLEALKKDLYPLPKFTFLPASFFYEFLKIFPLTHNIYKNNWLQIGCWKGGSTLFLASTRRDSNSNGKLYVIDTFGDIPTKNLQWEKDIAFVNYLQITTPIINYKNEVEELLNNYLLLENTILYKSKIKNVKSKWLPETLSFIFIDVDFYEPTLDSLQKSYEKLIPGGIILIDDYYSPLFNCKEAVDHFFDDKKIKEEVSFKQFSYNVLMITKNV